MTDADDVIPAVAQTSAQARALASPCVGVCRLNDQQICVGCGRHVIEITAAGVAAARARLANIQES